MKLVLVSIVCGIVVGYAAGGRLSRLADLRVRWPWFAIVGLGLQVAPISGRTLPLALLYVSFAMLLAFGLANVRAPGLALITIGLALNFAVIVLNQGMPATRAALVASDQEETLQLLVEDGGAKHHLAKSDDRLLFLADVIPVGGPVRQAISVGDVLVYLGVFWVVVAGMRGEREEEPRVRVVSEHAAA
jgi:hypothetical protein